MLMRFDPFRDLDRLSEELWGNAGRTMTRTSFPMDAYRRGDQFFVHFDLPGADPDSIELTVEKNVLTVRAVRNWQPQEGDEVVVHERPRGTFTRQLFLGETLDAGRIEAHYDQGVLTITLPVAEAAKPRKVAVSTGERSPQAIEADHQAA